MIDEQVDDDKKKYKLDNFEGPLDLLLHLIKGHKLDIKEIKLASLTEQYLEYMQQIDSLKIEKAAEFLEVAATLIEIKSKSLLPKPEVDIPVEQDTEAELLQRLEEYHLFKQQGEELKKQENVDRYYKQPSKEAGDFRIILGGFSFDRLIDAFASVMHKTDMKAVEVQPREIKRDRFTTSQKIVIILEVLKESEKTTFFSLFDDTYTRGEVIATFMAILELLKHEQIFVKQENAFEDIIITKNKNAAELDLAIIESEMEQVF